MKHPLLFVGIICFLFGGFVVSFSTKPNPHMRTQACMVIEGRIKCIEDPSSIFCDYPQVICKQVRLGNGKNM